MLFLQRFEVQGRSMEPFYRDGDYVIVLTETGVLSVGDTVVINKDGRNMLKRIAALPGEKAGSGTLGSAEYFVRSDNPTGTDSRQFGPVKKDEITGKVIWHIRKPRNSQPRRK